MTCSTPAYDGTAPGFAKNGCLFKVPGSCMLYSGSNIPAASIVTWETFDSILPKLITYINSNSGGGGGGGGISSFGFTNSSTFTGVVNNASTAPVLSLSINNDSISTNKIISVHWNKVSNKPTDLTTDPTRLVITSETALSTDRTLLIDATGGDVEITVNPSILIRKLSFKRIDNSANAVNIVTLSGTIDGETSKPIYDQYGGFTIQSDSTNLYIIY